MRNSTCGDGTTRLTVCAKQKKHSLRSEVPFFILIAPAMILVFLFSYLPMFGLLLAFKDYDPLKGIFGSPFTDMYGFGNFAEIFKTPELAASIWNTLYMNVLSLVIDFPAPIIFALLLSEIGAKTFKKTVQTISYLPHFLSWAAITGMVTGLLGEYGAINDIIKKLGGERILFLEKEGMFLPVYLLTKVWQSVGWGSIIYLASIAGISQELYEAAEIDGAGRFMQVWHITLPGILPTALILLILDVGSIFGSNFELVYGLQNKIAWKTEVISTAVYKYGIGQAEYSLATALGLMQGLVALILTFGANTISKKVSSVSMW